MVQPTVDIQRGLEAFYYLDERYYDNGANELKDRSGKQNHATAIGGPTVGMDGRAGLGAAAFDGTDDEFDAGSPLAVDGPHTAFVVARWDEKDADNGFFTAASNLGSSSGFSIRDSGGNLEARMDDGNSYENITRPLEVGRWYSILFGYDGEQIVLDIDGEEGQTVDFTGYSAASQNLYVGSGGGDKHLNGRIAAFGRWSRFLNRAERTYLGRLSSPRRAIV